MVRVGDVVLYSEGSREHETFWGFLLDEGEEYRGMNGTREHPAIVTRVWSETCVNLMVLFDGTGAHPRKSVSHSQALAEDIGESGVWRRLDDFVMGIDRGQGDISVLPVPAVPVPAVPVPAPAPTAAPVTDEGAPPAVQPPSA